MEFSKIGEHTIRCIITEDEIADLGYNVNDILENGAQTQEFMNHIFRLAEQEFSMKFRSGIKTVKADFLPDHTMVLTFSERAGEGMNQNHLKEIIDSFLNALLPERLLDNKQIEKKEIQQEGRQEKVRPKVIALFSFSEFHVLVTFSKQGMPKVIPKSSLYKMDQNYILIMDLSDCSEDEVRRLSIITDEYAQKVEVGIARKAYLEEHGECIIGDHAIEQLRQL